MAVGGNGPDSLRGRRSWMANKLSQLSNRSPNLAARAKYVGFGLGKCRMVWIWTAVQPGCPGYQPKDGSRCRSRWQKAILS